MNFRKGILITVVCLFTALATTVRASAQQIITFDAPSSGTGAFQGTASAAINWFGTITGSITDNNYGTHGFVRTPDGQFAEFDAPGADPIVGGTFPASINDLGVVTGYYTDTNGGTHGFLRRQDSHITTFDGPGTATGAAAFTRPNAINLEGAIAGSYLDAGGAFHGFVRSAGGKFTTFVAPGECTGGVNQGCHGTGAWNINLFGTIVGAYEDASGDFVAHTFIRSPSGKFTRFAVPGSSKKAGQGTLPARSSGLNTEGAITGLYYDANNAFHGFLRNPNGTFIKFEAPRGGHDDPLQRHVPSEHQ